MDRVAVFVDAGYLFKAGGRLALGIPPGDDRRFSRSDLSLDATAVEEFLRTFAEAQTGLPLLRIYWYDGTDSGPTPDHLSLMWTQNVKVRLGIVNRFGEQKGVDSLVVTDMINLSASTRVATAVLVTGDEDLRVGVQQAQAAGLRVHLVGFKPRQNNQSNLLQQEADVLHEWDETQVSAFLKPRAHHEPVEVVVAADASRDEVIEAVAREFAESLDETTRTALRSDFESGGYVIPHDLDRTLIRTLAEQLGDIEREDKRALRRFFRRLV